MLGIQSSSNCKPKNKRMAKNNFTNGSNQTVIDCYRPIYTNISNKIFVKFGTK